MWATCKGTGPQFDIYTLFPTIIFSDKSKNFNDFHDYLGDYGFPKLLYTLYYTYSTLFFFSIIINFILLVVTTCVQSYLKLF